MSLIDPAFWLLNFYAYLVHFVHSWSGTWVSLNSAKWVAVTLIVLSLLMLVIVLKRGFWVIWYRLFPMQVTRFGFRGRLAYADRGLKSEVFVSKSYELSAKPDFVFKLEDGTYALVEYKSGKRQMNAFDRVQVLASLVCVRTRFNVRSAFVATSLGVYPVDGAHRSTRSIYREISGFHRIARSIKQKNKNPKSINPTSCPSCSKRSYCIRRVQ